MKIIIRNYDQSFFFANAQPTVIRLIIRAGSSGDGGGGSAAWGSISGTLSNQTDLQTALDTKEDVANKSTDINLGTSNTLYPSQNAVKTYVDNNAGSGKIYSTFTIGAFDAEDPTSAKFDYFCDGVADQVQILAAIAALPSTGGRILLSEGTFNIAAAIVIDNDNVVLEGSGQATKIFLSNATNTNIITVGNGATAYTNITVKNLLLDGNKSNQTTDGHGIFISQGAAHTTIENCRISNTFKYSISDNGSAGANIINNYLESPGATSSYNIDFSGSNALIHGNVCSGATLASILADGSTHPSGIVISGNRCYPNSTTADGIQLAAWQVICSGNTISDFGGGGITSSVPAEITGNIIQQRNGVGNTYIYVSSSDPQLITGNTIFGYDNVTFACFGIYVDGSKSATVSGNNIQFESSTSPAHVGIRIAASLVNCTGNVITQYQFTGTGIQRSGTQTRGVISGNTITGFDIGIDITNTSYFTVGNNLIDCNAGVIATNATNPVIDGNNLFANTGTRIGISLQNTSLKTVAITGNNIFNFGAEAMYLNKITKSTISGNTITGCGTTQAIFIAGTSTYNTFSGNTVGKAAGTNTYSIREDTSGDGPNTYTGNITLEWTSAGISTQHTGSQVGLNITS